MKLFVRRTLCGCEFGICFNITCQIEKLKNKFLKKNKKLTDNNFDDDPNCLFDKDPLLLFTINVKSLFPILAGILIIALVYLAFIIKEIMEITQILNLKKEFQSILLNYVEQLSYLYKIHPCGIRSHHIDHISYRHPFPK